MVATLQRPTRWAVWLSALAVLALLAVGYYYFAGAAAAAPLRLVPQLTPVPLALEQLPLGAARLPVQVSGFIVSLTHDLSGPFTQPAPATWLLGLLALALTGWLVLASTLNRIPFAVAMGPVIFLLMSLNTEALDVLPGSARSFLYLALALLLGTAYALQAFGEGQSLVRRWLLLGSLVAVLGAVLVLRSNLPPAETALHLAAYATPGGAVLVLLVLLWVAIENVRIILWFNTQAEQPASRFGVGVFSLVSLLYLGLPGWWWWNNGQLTLFPGLQLDPLVLLLPALVAGWLGLRQRAPSYNDWLPFRYGLDQLYPVMVAAAAGVLAYAFATANTPLLDAAREATAMALLLLGGAFWLYVLINFLPLMRQKLRVYRVVFEPRRLPFYTVYVMGVAGMVMLQLRSNWSWLDNVSAGQYNLLGDLTRQQSEAHPDDLVLAGLAERYYAESGDVLDRNNQPAMLGRAALYRFRQQRQNELNALARAVRRTPSEKVTLRLAALLGDKQDLFDALDVLRSGLHEHPGSAAIANDLAQRFTQTSLTDSVTYYLGRTEALQPDAYPGRTNQLAFLLQQGLLPTAEKLPVRAARPNEPALASNQLLLALLRGQPAAATAAVAPTVLDDASFARLYHEALGAVRRRQGTLLPVLARLGNEPENEAYYEQLVFLQALTRHALGQEQVARQLLAPLAVGSSASAGYYQQLLGIWQLQQGQYATAAGLLGQAATHGQPAAAVMRSYALARAGRPDSARALLSRVLAAPDTALLPAAQALARQLAAGPLPAEAARPLAGTQLLAQARQAEAQPAVAAPLYRRLLREAPFNEAAVLAAGRFFARQRQYVPAYEALRLGLDENPESTALQQAYVLAAADAGLTDYAAQVLQQLQQTLPPAAYAAIAQQYAARQQARAAAMADFETR